ncbi:MAG TPA: hypothetical protein HPQ04_01045 [Rhodospirillaceae bacterium]|nr:hypothetical protein [Rhodospirillaceae bacterium]
MSFRKASDPQKTWVVVDVATTVDGIPHARLSSHGGGQITISTYVLTDAEYWVPVR